MKRLLLYSTVFFALAISGCVVSPDDSSANNAPSDTDAEVVSDAGQDAEVDSSACEPACSGDEPRCVEGECVECAVDSDEGCSGATPFCETTDAGDRCVECPTPGSDEGCSATMKCSDDFECVACLNNDDCPDRMASKCEDPGATDAACAVCEEADDCTHIAGANQCDAGTCVQCTPATEGADCDGDVCDPSTFECTEDAIASAGLCETCVSDSTCDADSFCVALDYDGSSQGNYCMPVAGPPGMSPRCPRPFGGGVATRSTTNGRSVEVCVLRENITTCEAISVFDDPCTLPGECKVGGVMAPGARCEQVGGDDKCTYTCTSDNDCKQGVECGGSLADGQHCGG